MMTSDRDLFSIYKTTEILPWLRILLVFCFFFSAQASADVSLPNGTYDSFIEDMRVKVIGGYIVVDREYLDEHWQITSRWNSLILESDSLGGGAISTIRRNGTKYEAYGDGWSAGQKNLILRATISKLPVSSIGFPTQGIPGKGGLSLTAEQGFRWQDRLGNWIHYDATGKIASYGDKNLVTVWFQYDKTGKLRYVLDHFGKVALIYAWTGDLLTEIKDNPGIVSGSSDLARSVRYFYDGTTTGLPAYPLLVKVTDVLGGETKYTYEAGRIKTVTDAELRTQSLEYGSTGRVTRVISADGSQKNYVYDYDKLKKEFYVKVHSPKGDGNSQMAETWFDSNGVVVRKSINGISLGGVSKDARFGSVTDPAGETKKVDYDEFGNAVKVTYQDGSVAAYEYAAGSDRRTKAVTPLGVTITYEYDAKGNPVRQVEAAGKPGERITEYSYDELGRLSQISLMEDARTAKSTVFYEYDERGNAIKVSDAEGRSTSYSYDVTGKVVSATDAAGKTWKNKYNAAGSVVSSENPLSFISSFEYDKTGNWIKTKDQRGKEYQYEYDAGGRVTRITDPLGNSSRMVFDAVGYPKRIEDASGVGANVEYDNLGRVSKALDEQNHAIQYVYPDAESGANPLRAKQVIYPTFQTSSDFDKRGWTSAQTVSFDGQSIQTRYQYDLVGQLKTVTNAYGKDTVVVRDALGRVISTTDPVGRKTQFEYDNHGNVTAVVDPRGKRVSFEFDRTNKVTKITRPLGQISRFAYDKNGLLSEFIDAKGQIKRFEYDEAGRHISTKVFVAGDQQAIRTLIYGYDPIGNLLTWSDGAVTGTYSYDALGRLDKQTINYGAFALSHSYSYYANGQTKSITYPDNTEIGFEYDANAYLSSITIPNEGLISFTDRSWIAPKKVVFPGGTTAEYTYDGLLNITGYKLRNPGQTSVLTQSYTYGKRGEVLEQSTNSDSRSYVYDDTGRLTGVNGNISYGLDAASNRISDSNIGSLSYDDNNRLLTAGNASYTYDENGNLQTKRVGGTVVNRFAYDAFNRLEEVQDGSGNIVAKYGYDIFDRRIWKDANGVRTYYYHAAEGLLAEVLSNGAVSKIYGYTPGSSWGSNPVFQRNDGAYSYFHKNRLGAPIVATNKAGDTVWSANYDVFGKANVVGGVVNNIRLPGQYYDSETGLHYNNRRYYDPIVGRYVTEDPIGLSGGLNTYSYVGHDPVNAIDPSGENPALIIIGYFVRNYACCVIGCNIFRAIVDECYDPTLCFKDCLEPEGYLIPSCGLLRGPKGGGKGPGAPKGPTPGKPGPSTAPPGEGPGLGPTPPKPPAGDGPTPPAGDGKNPPPSGGDPNGPGPNGPNNGGPHGNEGAGSGSDGNSNGPSASPGGVGSPGSDRATGEIKQGSQNKHIPGTNENNMSPGKTTWANPAEANELTREAAQKGTVTKVSPDGSSEIKWDAGRPVGSDGETQVTVKVTPKGDYHGYPSGPKM